jgi:hypothetical protein
MSVSKTLEHRYRRLLAFYPRSFRREHEQEILSVLMAGAAEGQRRPRLAECADLLKSAIFMRLRQVTFTLEPSWAQRHRRVLICLRVGIGVWLLIVTAILCNRGYWWGLVILAPAAAHFYLAQRLGRPARS